MALSYEQRAAVKFSFLLGKTVAETYNAGKMRLTCLRTFVICCLQRVATNILIGWTGWTLVVSCERFENYISEYHTTV
jgi:hypothetical protein